MYIYHALINALSAHMIHINLNMIFYTHVEYSPTKTIYIKYYFKKLKKHYKHPHTLYTLHVQLFNVDNTGLCFPLAADHTSCHVIMVESG